MKRGALLAGMVPPLTNAEVCDRRAKRLAADGYCVRCGRERAAPERTCCNGCLDNQLSRALARAGRSRTTARCSGCHQVGHTFLSCARRVAS